MYLNAYQLKRKENPSLLWWIEAYKEHLRRYRQTADKAPQTSVVRQTNTEYAEMLGAVLPLLQSIYRLEPGRQEQHLHALIALLEQGHAQHVQLYGMAYRSDSREMREAILANLKSIKLKVPATDNTAQARLEALASFLRDGHVLVFHAKSDGYALTYQIYEYDIEGQITFVVMDQDTLLFERVHPDLATLVAKEPVDMNKFTLQLREKGSNQ